MELVGRDIGKGCRDSDAGWVAGGRREGVRVSGGSILIGCVDRIGSDRGRVTSLVNSQLS